MRARACGQGRRPGRAASFARAAFAALAVATGLTGSPAAAAGGPSAVVDDRGVTVRLPAAPRRIVSLMPSLTESVCVLGACGRLVAVDRFSDWPASVRALPHLGGLGDTDVEGVVAARPDLVLVSPSARVAGRLEELGLTVAAFDARTIADVRRVLRDVSLLIGSGDADRAWAAVDGEIAAAARAVPAGERGSRAYVEVDAEGYAASASSFVGELLARLGLRDVVPAGMGPYPRVTPEFVVRADPQLIVVAGGEPGQDPARPGWDAIDAVRAHRVCRLDAADRDVLGRPGPRLGTAAWILARCAGAVERR